MIIELACCTTVLLAEIANRKATRDTVAGTYALAIRSSEKTDWRKVNEAIIARWSPYALEYIKQRAWKLVEARAALAKMEGEA